MAYAIIETGGKQLKVEPGRFYDVELLHSDVDAAISIDQVLLVNDGTSVTVGQPLVKGAVVEATVMQHLRAKKILVYKMRPKKKTRKKQGHRQSLTRLMINSISVGGKAIATA
jgi:large subunit ribosomal protein L21